MPRPPGEVGGPVAEAVNGASVRGVVAALAGQRTDAEREVGRQVVGTAAEDVALLDQRGDDAGQRSIGRPPPSGRGEGAPAGRASCDRAA